MSTTQPKPGPVKAMAIAALILNILVLLSMVIHGAVNMLVNRVITVGVSAVAENAAGAGLAAASVVA